MTVFTIKFFISFFQEKKFEINAFNILTEQYFYLQDAVLHLQTFLKKSLTKNFYAKLRFATIFLFLIGW